MGPVVQEARKQQHQGIIPGSQQSLKATSSSQMTSTGVTSEHVYNKYLVSECMRLHRQVLRCPCKRSWEDSLLSPNEYVHTKKEVLNTNRSEYYRSTVLLVEAELKSLNFTLNTM